MASSRLFRPSSCLLSAYTSSSLTPAARPSLLRTRNVVAASSLVGRRTYANPSGSKDYSVREALNEALAEELEQNPKVFVLGEEVAQYNGA